MKKFLLVPALGLSLISVSSYAEPVRDVSDLTAVHHHISQSIKEMEKAREANHYDMAGHGAKVEQLLREAERELRLSIEAAKQAK